MSSSSSALRGNNSHVSLTTVILYKTWCKTPSSCPSLLVLENENLGHPHCFLLYLYKFPDSSVLQQIANIVVSNLFQLVRPSNDVLTLIRRLSMLFAALLCYKYSYGTIINSTIIRPIGMELNPSIKLNVCSLYSYHWQLILTHLHWNGITENL